MRDTTRMQAGQNRQGERRAAGAKRLGACLLLAGGLLGGCGIGGPVAEGSAALLSGMPKCDASLLHPHLEVGAAAGLPGKQIVYVDGVMACVDDASRVDQLMTQIEGRSLGTSLTLPAAAVPANSAAPVNPAAPAPVSAAPTATPPLGLASASR